MTHEVQTRVDVAFPLLGERVPVDHGYALFGALSRVLGNDLHGADWLAVHPLWGVPQANKMLHLGRSQSSLRLRIDAAAIPKVLPLAGKLLDVAGNPLRVGVPNVYALGAAPVLFARMVVIKGFMAPDSFTDAARRQLDALGVKARFNVTDEDRKVLSIRERKVVGFTTVLHDLSDEDSIKVQCAGLGGRQRFGCGVFVPMQERGL